MSNHWNRMKKVRKKCSILLVLALANFLLMTKADNAKQKRQIFREQVLPALGGKIPEEAFRSDRLALNRLNKEGISVPDGVVLDSRQVVKHSTDSAAPKPGVIKVYLTPDGRYVPPQGRFHDSEHKSVETTYIIRMPVQHGVKQKPTNVAQNYRVHVFEKPRSYIDYKHPLPETHYVYKPIITPLELPTRPQFLYHTYYEPSWNFQTQWNHFYEPFGNDFADKLSLFNHDIIANYQGFLHDFHGRALRHVDPIGLRNQVFPSGKLQRKSSGAKTSGYADLPV